MANFSEASRKYAGSSTDVLGESWRNCASVGRWDIVQHKVNCDFERCWPRINEGDDKAMPLLIITTWKCGSSRNPNRLLPLSDEDLARYRMRKRLSQDKVYSHKQAELGRHCILDVKFKATATCLQLHAQICYFGNLEQHF
jgi:hypothetical protein